MEIATFENTAAKVGDNIASALSTAMQDGKKVFNVVSVVDDEASFTRVADPLAGNAIGILGGRVEEQDGTCDREVLCRTQFSILVRIQRQRNPGEGESAALNEVARLAEIAKRSILSDRTRGGLCRLIVWNGAIINCTEIAGQLAPVRRVANQSFFTASFPVVCGWIIGR
jgi:hypothetical protein